MVGVSAEGVVAHRHAHTYICTRTHAHTHKYICTHIHMHTHTHTVGGIPAQAGYNAGDHYKLLVEAGDIRHIDSRANVGRPGVFIYRVDRDTSSDFCFENNGHDCKLMY